MHEIIDRGDPFEREVWARDEAMSHYEKIKEPFKVELIEGIPDDEPISFYRQGNFLIYAEALMHHQQNMLATLLN